MACLNSELSLDQVAEIAKTNMAFIYDKFDSVFMVHAIKGFFKQATGLSNLPFRDNIDTFIYYVGEKSSYLYEFVNGCSNTEIILDWNATMDLIKYLHQF